mgnify:FL=1
MRNKRHGYSYSGAYPGGIRFESMGDGVSLADPWINVNYNHEFHVTNMQDPITLPSGNILDTNCDISKFFDDRYDLQRGMLLIRAKPELLNILAANENDQIVFSWRTDYAFEIPEKP